MNDRNNDKSKQQPGQGGRQDQQRRPGEPLDKSKEEGGRSKF